MSFRRTWDKAFYEQKAKDRLEHGDEYVDEENDGNRTKVRKVMKEEFKAADGSASGKARDISLFKSSILSDHSNFSL
jgi:hypothetical protein